ncbi:TPA: hypothetical protein ACGFUW_001418 [Flavobacterium psychrophilum]|jgi:hypothetical protein
MERLLKFPKLEIDSIFNVYNKEEILEKLQKLKYFCFLRGRLNSYVTDGDEIITHIEYYSKDDLILKLKSLGVEIKILNTGDEISYGKPWPDCLNYPTPSRPYPDIAEPAIQTIFEENVSIYISDKYFTISINNLDKDKWFLVNYNQIESAVKIERKLEDIDLAKSITIEGQKEFGRFINRYHYPELFEKN